MNSNVRRSRPRPNPRSQSRHGRPRPRPIPRVQTDPRFSRRRRAVAREQHRKQIFRWSTVGLICLGVWAAFFSPLLRVKEVKVIGARHTSMEDVTAAAAVDSDENVLLLSTSEVAQRVRTLPWIKSVDVDRMLPGTVRIKITERRPAMVLSLGAARWTLDSSGRVLESGQVDKKLPVLAGVQIATIEPGVELRTEEARAAMSVWRRLPAALRRQLVGIVAPTVERITLSLRDGTLVRYGAPEDTRAKNEVLAALLRRVRLEGMAAAYIDVRVPLQPAVSEREDDVAVGASDADVADDDPSNDDVSTEDTSGDDAVHTEAEAGTTAP